tara:strand:+ start:14625 stop:15341 length:717 start_codon:yes stop_codon:yes gene_type:complete
MENKRGGTHVGFVLSFVIFVTFLLFLYSMLIEPTKTNQDKQFLLDKVEINLIEKFSSEFMVSSISVVENATQNCIKLDDLITDLEINKKIIVKNELNDIQTSYVVDTNDLEIVRSNTNNVFFKVYNSEKFEELSDTGTNPCPKKDYEKGLVKVNKNIFEVNIIGSIDEYENDYENLKEDLEIPPGTEFSFSFEYNNGTIIKPEEKIPDSINVHAEENSIQYLDRYANVLLGNLVIKIW